MFNRNVISFCLLTIVSYCSLSSAIFSSERGESRILGGVAATAATLNRASVASVRLYTSQGHFHVCGGFIINRRWVGTAAQCMTDKTTNNAAVSVGSLAIGGGTIYNLDRIEKHENFNVILLILLYEFSIKRPFFQATSLAHNVALLRTRTDIVFTGNVQPIRVAAERLEDHRLIMILGWGRTSSASNFPDSLMTAQFNTLPLGTCLAGFPYVTRNYITDEHICTSFAGRATCPGKKSKY